MGANRGGQFLNLDILHNAAPRSDTTLRSNGVYQLAGNDEPLAFLRQTALCNFLNFDEMIRNAFAVADTAVTGYGPWRSRPYQDCSTRKFVQVAFDDGKAHPNGCRCMIVIFDLGFS